MPYRLNTYKRGKKTQWGIGLINMLLHVVLSRPRYMEASEN